MIRIFVLAVLRKLITDVGVFSKSNLLIKQTQVNCLGINIVYVSVSCTNSVWHIWLHRFQIYSVFMDIFYCSCQRLPKTNYPVIRYTGLNGNSTMVSSVKGITIVVFSVIWRLSDKWCVAVSWLLRGIWWYTCGEVSLVYEDYCFFI